MHVIFEWDETKRRVNLARHGVDFADADRLDWATATIAPDLRRDYGEARVIVVGQIDGRLHVLIMTRRGDRIRVISLRKANEREQRRWRDGR
jgi:uncharacterized DUF497 family protein